MNELKPEDVMMALECCKMHGMIYCKKCPYYKDKINPCLKTMLDDALALLRERDATLEMCAETIERQDKEIAQKDAEIERLKVHLDYKCVYGYDGEVMEFCVQGPCPHYKTVSQIRAEAINEFAERLGGWFSHDPAFLAVERRLVLDIVDQIAKEMKGETDERSD